MVIGYGTAVAISDDLAIGGVIALCPCCAASLYGGSLSVYGEGLDLSVTESTVPHCRSKRIPCPMSKSALSKSVREVTGCTVAQADAAVDAVLNTIVEGVKTDGSFRLTGFGTFAKSERPTRQGRNPKTGEAIEIAASASIKFSTAAALKKSL